MNLVKFLICVCQPRLLRWFGITPFEEDPIVVVGIPGSGHGHIARSLASILGRTFIDSDRYYDLSDVIERLYRANDNGEKVVVSLNSLTSDEQARIRTAVPVTFVGVAIDEATLRGRYYFPGVSPGTRRFVELLLSGPVIATVIAGSLIYFCDRFVVTAMPVQMHFALFPIRVYSAILCACIWPLICFGIEDPYPFDGNVKAKLNSLLPKVRPSTGDPSRGINRDLARFQMPRGDGTYRVNGAHLPCWATRSLILQAVFAARERRGVRHA